MSEGACILVGDIGGTNVRFALARASQRRVVISDLWKRPGAEFASFSAAIAAYRRHAATPVVVLEQREMYCNLPCQIVLRAGGTDNAQ